MIKFQLTVGLSYKYGTIFREVVNTPALNLCSLITGGKNHKLATMFIDIARDFASFAQAGCPLTVIEIKNLTVATSKLLSTFPSGDYRANLTFFINADDKAFQLTVINVITSNIRTSF